MRCLLPQIVYEFALGSFLIFRLVYLGRAAASPMELGEFDFLFAVRVISAILIMALGVMDVVAFNFSEPEPTNDARLSGWANLVIREPYGNFWSRRYYLYLTPLFKFGATTNFEAHHLGKMSQDDKAVFVARRFRTFLAWKEPTVSSVEAVRQLMQQSADTASSAHGSSVNGNSSSNNSNNNNNNNNNHNSSTHSRATEASADNSHTQQQTGYARMQSDENDDDDSGDEDERTSPQPFAATEELESPRLTQAAVALHHPRNADSPSIWQVRIPRWKSRVRPLFRSGRRANNEFVPLDELGSELRGQSPPEAPRGSHSTELVPSDNKPPQLRSIFRVVMLTMRRDMLEASVWMLLSSCFMFLNPTCLRGILAYVVEIQRSDSDSSSSNSNNTSLPLNGSVTAAMPPHEVGHVSWNVFFSNGYVLAFVMFFGAVVQTMSVHSHNHMAVRAAIRLRSAFMTTVYRKALRLSPQARAKSNTGSILNHMSIDTTKVMMLLFFVHYFWAIPLQVLIAIIYLTNVLGYAALIGFLVIVLVIPVQLRLATYITMLNKQAMARDDSRVKKITELINGMKVIKLYAWEPAFLQRALAARAAQLAIMFRVALLNALLQLIQQTLPMLITVTAFASFAAISDEPLTPTTAFTALSLYELIRIPLYMLPLIIRTATDARVSMTRLQAFLELPELSHDLGDGVSAQSHEDEDDDWDRRLYQDFLDSEAESMELQASGVYGGVDQVVGVLDPSLADPDHPTKERAAPMWLPRPPAAHRRPRSDQHRAAQTRDASQQQQPAEVSATNATFSWLLEANASEETARVSVLPDVTLRCTPGTLTLIAGRLASGKTSLISALLGEMPRVRGRRVLRGSVAYVAQSAWILNASIRDNITFQTPFNAERYQEVLSRCALGPDIESLAAGDRTEIGEKGINLSGGQKQRISIARALYSDADVVLFDDPLSALDAHVGHHIFHKVILEALVNRGKAVLLSTHQLQYLPFATNVVVLQSMSILAQGTLEQLVASGVNMSVLGAEVTETASPAPEQADSIEASPQLVSAVPSTDEAQPGMTFQTESAMSTSDEAASKLASPSNSRVSDISSNENTDIELIEADEEDDGLQTTTEDSSDTAPLNGPAKTTKSASTNGNGSAPSLPNGTSSARLIDHEKRAEGAVSWRVYKAYFAASGLGLWMGVFCLCIVTRSVLVTTDWWLSLWANADDSADAFYYVKYYAILVSVSLVLSGMVTLSMSYLGFRSARELHAKMLNRIAHAPMMFFDTTPVGRIQNRFTSDVNSIDTVLIVSFQSLAERILFVLSSLVVQLVVAPWFSIPLVPILCVYFWLQNFFRKSSRELQRLDSVTKSPIFANFAETLEGLATIRAYRAQASFAVANARNVERNALVVSALYGGNRWIAIRIEGVGSTIILAAAISSLLAANTIDAGLVGLALSYAMTTTLLLNIVVRNYTDTEMQMNSVQRVSEYASLAIEKDTVAEGESGFATTEDAGTLAGVYSRPDLDLSWPSRGNIEFENVTVCYRPNSAPVLQGVSLTVKAGERIGICGRTGSGKSTLTLALFRIVPCVTGRILIDGQDIASIPLARVRGALAIIPQDPLLFAGTVRYNLDPAMECTDDQLWAALRIAQLDTVVEQLRGSQELVGDRLDFTVSEGGSNFSTGQRQLFCMARAFLRRARILVLDEASASVDYRTDAMLQHVIRTAFHNCTILVIAHRIATIADSDRILGLEAGRVVEFDTPAALLQQESSLFGSLMRAHNRHTGVTAPGDTSGSATPSNP
ncbi:multidrug resistance-associated protein 13 [Capsaspora owczarzaki ATCC 30864]|nr:multidrug resistance-associated protein 13 [Capsaspora owczarzaki ATCC 30864]|eukprot:XP_004365809.1 multidrug resistance-associated protein 13 [Capsaspora owczarzaki ATCC 30864]